MWEGLSNGKARRRNKASVTCFMRRGKMMIYQDGRKNSTSFSILQRSTWEEMSRIAHRLSHDKKSGTFLADVLGPRQVQNIGQIFVP